MKFKFKHPTEKVLIFILLLIIGLQVVVLWDFGQKINTLWTEVNGVDNSGTNQVDGISGFPLKVYIQDAVKGVYSLEPVVDPLKSVIYLPEVRISLPLRANSRDIRYNYEPASSVSPAQVAVSTNHQLNNLVANFSDVTCAQRMVGFNVDKKDGFASGGKYAGSAELADGRTLHFWVNENSASCLQFWGDKTQQDILNLLKQAVSY